MTNDLEFIKTPFDKFKKDYFDKKVLILGLGLQGRGVGDAKVFAEIGSQVRVSDSASSEKLQPSLNQLKDFSIEYHLGENLESDILWADVIIRNASVPWNHPLLIKAREWDKPIKEDAALFFEYANPSKVIGVTGTRGKSTTTSLIHHILQGLNLKTQLAGNIVPIASLELLKTYNPDCYYVFELSSWQLQVFESEKISPKIAVITNIYPDHLLDRTFEEYIQDKKAIYINQKPTDVVFLNPHNKDSISLSEEAKGQVVWFDPKKFEEVQFNLVGEHNRQNLAAALSVSEYLNLDMDKVKQIVSTFAGLEFRQQIVCHIGNLPIINDTTSTTPIALSIALKTYSDSIFIIGGNSKKLPTDELVSDINQHAFKVILLKGSGTEEIKHKINKNLILGEYDVFKEAVSLGLKIAKELNKPLVLSPGFTSFGMFLNEFDRGRQFNQLVEVLNEK